MELEDAIKRLRDLSNIKISDLDNHTLVLSNFRSLQQDIKIVLKSIGELNE